ncbi:MAG TPA: SusD/RagB family nutrient-binding outer membrane lipoprotein [Bacteroidales bacterium]|nr:SusD/RagB family nutrient-binding outer membrane lipoprotein [Bacteroidales bacterium]
MKAKNILSIFAIFALSLGSCDKGFVEKNTNPLLATTIDPAYELVSAQIIALNIVHYEGCIVQQAQHLLGGAEEGGNRNTWQDRYSNNHFNALYGNQIRNLVDIINMTKDNPAKSNLYNMARILKAYSFQMLVDRYGDVPYSEAGLGYLRTTNADGTTTLSRINFPKYDEQRVIYDDIAKELKEAVDALDATKDNVSQEMYFGGNIPRWKKFGNSLLLRVGMRYTKVDPVKAKSIVQIATDPARGGVMTSNSDNVVLKCNSIQNNPSNDFINGSVRYIWHVGKPFVDFLKVNNDPRLKYIAALYPNPSSSTNPGTPNTNPASQIGCPYGYTDVNITTAPGYPGKIGNAFKYSQFNRSTIGRIDAWLYYVTYAQTQLLMAEARYRNYITTGEVKDYYESAIKAHMTQVDTWSSSGAASPITTAEQNAYLLEPAIAYNPAQALKQINEQYWVASLMIWGEAWANFRRSGYPQLQPINFPGEDAAVAISTGGDGFIHRLQYSLKEWSVNPDNVKAAADRIGGDNMKTRVFWDL